VSTADVILGMPPEIELRLRDGSGTRWRVHDVVYGVPPARPFHRVLVPLGDVRATDRWFVAEDGRRLAYRFAARERHDFTLSALVRQLGRAGIPAGTRDVRAAVERASTIGGKPMPHDAWKEFRTG
jgi:hypothetical protein